MKQLSLTIKIIIIFLIPAITLLYFSWYFTNTKYDNLNESLKNQLVANMTEQFSKLIHNLQKERGLSSGYIITENKEFLKDKLLQQYIQTDKAYTKVLELINLETKEKNLILKEIGIKRQPLIKKVVYDFNQIQDTRTKVLNSSINFNDEINYYSEINSKIIKIIEIFSVLLKHQNNDAIIISKIQNLKENAGLERAFVYFYLLGDNEDKYIIKNILQIQNSQKKDYDEFLLYASIDSTITFTQIIDKQIMHKVENLRTKLKNNTLVIKDSKVWFKYTSEKIDMFETLSTNILHSYTQKANTTYQEALTALYISAFLWFLSLISLSVLILILKKMINKEILITEELRISAYTFNSHEAMTITDVNGIILKVNNAFTKITGYSQEEVIGQNPKILKSMKHDDEFYKNMWYELHTKGKWSKDIYNKRKNGDIYLERLSITAIKDVQDTTTHYIAQFLDISELQEAKEQAEYFAEHDFLTSLANRKYLLTRLNEEFMKSKRDDFLNAFLFIDLDHFKKINDEYGHNIGDALIKEVASRLKLITREEDLIARIGGDEFAILLLNLNKDKHEAIKDINIVCTKVLRTIREPFILEGNHLNISSSIGIKLFPESEKNSNDVIIHADTAMYQAKHRGKNQFVFFDRKIEFELQQLTLLEEEIKEAFEENQFELFFQAKVNTQTGTIYGAELLARWNHPSKGLLFPDSFVDVSTNIGLSHNFTVLALHTACKFIQTHQDIFKGKLAININSKELLSPSFEEEVIEIISSYNISPSQIELEILEDEIIKDFDLVVSKIKKLQEFGLEFSIDDFGTGYSSITYLKKLPVNTLKIDRDFLLHNDKHSYELIIVIIQMAKIFNMNIVVEGVESQEQLSFISKYGADVYQGFYFSKAIQEEKFITLLQKEIKS